MEKKRRPIPTYSHLSGESGLSLFFSDSPSFFFNSKSHSDASANEIVIFELEKNKEEGRRKFFGFLKQELEIYKLNFPQEIEFLRHDLLAKSSLTNSRC